MTIRIPELCVFALICLSSYAVDSFADTRDPVTDRYSQARLLLPANASTLVKNTSVKPHWLSNDDSFWYQRQTEKGHQFVWVNSRTGKKKPAFNHKELAQLITMKTGNTASPDKLPINLIDIDTKNSHLDFSYLEQRYRFNTESEILTTLPIPPGNADHLMSPDKQWRVFREQHNIWLQNQKSGKKSPLTKDGSIDYAYAKLADVFAVKTRIKGRDPIVALWSPDSSKLFTYRLDERTVREQFLIQSLVDSEGDTNSRKNLFPYRYARAGDKAIGKAELRVFDIPSGEHLAADYPPLSDPSFILLQHAWWSDDSRYVYFVNTAIRQQQVTLCELDTTTGHVREIIREGNDTFIDLNVTYNAKPNVRTLTNSREVIWFSERDGWGHLYLYDLDSGRLKNKITRGEWVVRDILYVHEAKRTITFSANGREAGEDPYLRHIYRINMDGTGLRLLTPEPADHEVVLSNASVNLRDVLSGSAPSLASGFSPSGDYFVDTYARIGQPPVTVLRNSQGDIIAPLEKADIGQLEAQGFSWPEPFKVKDRNGEYDIYGNIYYPPNREPGKKYPVIDAIYPGPQSIRSHKTLLTGYLDDALALSHLGFIVVTVDGLGTPYRSKAFHDNAFANLQDAGLPDHIAAIQQLAQDRQEMDLDRVGIYGISAGGYAAVRAMLTFPDFYKVGVGLQPYDPSVYRRLWTERYQGPDKTTYALTSNVPLAKNLNGKLLLSYADLDNRVHPSSVLSLIDALIKANKKVDVVVSPNDFHGHPNTRAYVTERVWDFFTRHLPATQEPDS